MKQKKSKNKNSDIDLAIYNRLRWQPVIIYCKQIVHNNKNSKRTKEQILGIQWIFIENNDIN